jgi:acetyl/propionyl-CoA carboxylase alpha subunit
MMDSTGAFYFLEMNTRIQVEHPVTEAVTGLDLVELQIRIAAGEAIPFEQADVKLSGHAIEARIYAEDPDTGFVPSPGPILAWHAPEGPGIRLDAGFEAGQTVTPHYDAMLAKLIVTGRDRDEALARLARALEAFWVAGIKTGLPFLRRLAANPGFAAGAYDTGFLEAEMARAGSPLAAPRALDDENALVVAGAVAWRMASASAGDGGADGPVAGSRYRVTLPKQTPVEVGLLSIRPAERSERGAAAGGASRVELSLRIGDRDQAIAIEVVAGAAGSSVPEDVLFDVESTERTVRMSLVRKKSGELEVGLRDRVIRVKVEPA